MNLSSLAIQIRNALAKGTTAQTTATAAAAAAAAAQSTANAAMASGAAAGGDLKGTYPNPTLGFPGSGFGTNYKHPAAPVSLVATSGTASIPGPAVGYLRLFGTLYFTNPAASGTFALTVIHQPSGLYLTRGASFTAGAASNFVLTSRLLVLGNGETLECSNTGDANGTLWYTYYDFPSTGITLVRAQLDTNGTTIIPAAASGYYNKFLMGGQGIGGVAQAYAAWSALAIYNDDTIAHILDMYFGSDFAARSGSSNAAAAPSSPGSIGDLVITTTPLIYKLKEAVATRSPNILTAYRTFAGTP